MKAFSAELKVPEARPTPGSSEIMSVNQACTFLAVVTAAEKT
jgi:hypothetical protein